MKVGTQAAGRSGGGRPLARGLTNFGRLGSAAGRVRCRFAAGRASVF